MREHATRLEWKVCFASALDLGPTITQKITTFDTTCQKAMAGLSQRNNPHRSHKRERACTGLRKRDRLPRSSRKSICKDDGEVRGGDGGVGLQGKRVEVDRNR